jgi:hypothetical protein
MQSDVFSDIVEDAVVADDEYARLVSQMAFDWLGDMLSVSPAIDVVVELDVVVTGQQMQWAL